MLYTAQDMATMWGISVQMVRRYCKEGKVDGAVQTEQGWMIPEGSPKPGIPVKKQIPKTPLVKKLLYQHARNNHFGIYEYVQVNLAYSSSRMASNRLTRHQVEEIYRTRKIATAFEPTRVDDIVEISNHFICMRYVIEHATGQRKSFSRSLIQQMVMYSDRKQSMMRLLAKAEKSKQTCLLQRSLWQQHRGHLFSRRSS